MELRLEVGRSTADHETCHWMQPIRVVARGLGMGVSDEVIYTKLKDDLVRYATALVGPVDAEDVLSTVVLRTLQRRSLNDLENARAYLFRAVLNESRGLHRRRRIPPVEPPGLAEEMVIPDGDREVVNVLRALAPRQRAAVYLVYWEDLSIADAAAAMGARPGTVKRYLHLARRSLKGTLNDIQ